MEVSGNPTSDSPTFQESNDDKLNDALKQVKANKSTVPRSQVSGIVHPTGNVGGRKFAQRKAEVCDSVDSTKTYSDIERQR